MRINLIVRINMKKSFKIFAAIITVSLALPFAGCGNSSESSASSSSESSQTATTADAETTAASSAKIPEVLTSLHSIDTENGNEFAGTWKIVEGVGSKLDSFVFEFNGDKEACLIIDNVGYIGTYSLEETDGKKTFKTQLLFGLDGVYTYEFSSDKSSVTLTNTDDNSTTKMKKVENVSCIPEPEANPTIDEKLLGAWQSSEGDTVYFDKCGIMYSDSYGVQFTFSKYSAKDSTVTSTYKMKQETTDTYSYSVSGDTLKLNDYEYNKISVDELA